MKKYRFIPWLRRQVKRDDAIGDLARDAFVSSSDAGRSLLSLESHMFGHHASPKAWDALEEAKKEYEEYASG
jgi:hypothetical protein